jgi:hypothetical protein
MISSEASAQVELHRCLGRVLLSSNDDVVEVGGRLPKPPLCPFGVSH